LSQPQPLAARSPQPNASPSDEKRAAKTPRSRQERQESLIFLAALASLAVFWLRAPWLPRAYAALALVPLLDLPSPPLEDPPLLVSDEVLVSSLFFELPSFVSVFGVDLASPAVGFDSVEEGFFEP
jgi:hypothetical protein